MIKTGIRIEDKKIVFESITWTAIEPSTLNIGADEAKEYIKKHPMPKDPEYSAEDLIGDLQTDGFWTLPMTIKPETEVFIIDLIDELI